MRKTFLALVAFDLALSLSACALVGQPGTSALLASTKAFVVAEQSFDTAVEAADITVNTGSLAPATVQKIKTIADQGYGAIKLGRAAIAAGNASSISAEQSALTSFVTQLAALVPAKS
ncbi:MAG TPA: hypothetical protein VG248_03335 [Caulobacteraceae bacterium]|jgi:hypothetical protein|nr:hypothetical protein [Caulobacteraceae bacterium]